MKEAEVGLYHVDEKEPLLLPRGKRVFCQGRWGVVEKVRGGSDAPWVEIRFSDGTKATNAALGNAVIRLDGRYSSPAVKIRQQRRRRPRNSHPHSDPHRGKGRQEQRLPREKERDADELRQQDQIEEPGAEARYDAESASGKGHNAPELSTESNRIKLNSFSMWAATSLR